MKRRRDLQALLLGLTVMTSFFVPAFAEQSASPFAQTKNDKRAAESSYPIGFQAVNENLWVSGYVETSEQVRALKQSGIETVISLVPAAEKPAVDERLLVTSAGLSFEQLSIANANDLTRSNVEKFHEILQIQGDKQVLVHCGSGNRAGAMMALRAAWFEGMSRDDAIMLGQQFGLKSLQPAVEKLLQGAP